MSLLFVIELRHGFLRFCFEKYSMIMDWDRNDRKLLVSQQLLLTALHHFLIMRIGLPLHRWRGFPRKITLFRINNWK